MSTFKQFAEERSGEKFESLTTADKTSWSEAYDKHNALQSKFLLHIFSI